MIALAALVCLTFQQQPRAFVQLSSAGRRHHWNDVLPAGRINGAGKSSKVCLNAKENVRIVFGELAHDTRLFVLEMKKRAKIENTPFDANERRALNELLHRHLHEMDASSTASLIANIGAVGGGLHREGALCADAIGRHVDSFSNFEIVNILIGLGKLNVDWDNIKSKDRVYARLTRAMALIDEKSFADIMYAMGMLNLRWNKVPKPLQTSIFSNLVKHISKLKAFSLTSILWSLAKFGTKWTDLPTELQQTIPTRLLSQQKEMSPQQSSKALWAMGSMGADHRALPHGFVEFHLENVNSIKRSKMGFAVPASQTLTGLAKLGLSWDDCSARVRASIWEQFMRVVQSTNDKGIVNAVWALGTMGPPADAQPCAVRDAMFRAIVRALDKTSSWGVCNVLWGLAKMRFVWVDLPQEVQDSCLANLVRIEAEMNALDTGILLFSLGCLQTPLDTLPGALRESLFNSTERNFYSMRAQELANSIWGLSQGGLSWDDLPFKVQWGINVTLRRLSESMGFQDVARCAYGLAILAFDSTCVEEPAFRGAHEAARSAIRRALKHGTKPKAAESLEEFEQLRIFAHYLAVNRLSPEIEDLPCILFEPSDLDSSSNQKSRLQKRVIQGVRDGFAALNVVADYTVLPESSSFAGVFPVDASVRYRGKDVAFLEVDGPSHYRFDGKLKRKDRLKEAMYRKKHPHATFHRIKFDSENKLGSDAIGIEVAELIVQSTVSGNPFEAWIKDVSADIKLFFDKTFVWSLRNSPTTPRKL